MSRKTKKKERPKIGFSSEFNDWKELRPWLSELLSLYDWVLKPDKAIYNCLLERYGLQPEESIFLDDNADNVAGAEAVGMKALRFESALQAEQELKECYGIEL